MGVSSRRKSPLRMLGLFLGAAGLGLVVSLLTPVPTERSGRAIVDGRGE